MSQASKAAEALKKFTSNSLNKLSKGFGKLSDEELKLFDEVKQKLGKDSKEYDNFVSQMSSARKQNSLNAYAEQEKPNFAERKKARTKQNLQDAEARNQRKLEQQKIQEQYEAHSTGQYDTVTSPRNVDYAGAKGSKEIVNESAYEQAKNTKYLPATPEQLQEANKSYSDAMGAAHYDAQQPKPNNGPNYNNARGKKEKISLNSEDKARAGYGKNGISEITLYNPNNSNTAFDNVAEYVLKRKTLDNANKTGWEHFKDAVSDIWVGSGFNKQTTANRRAYNEHLHSQGNTGYIKSNREFQRIQSDMGIHGTFTGKAEGFDALNRAHARVSGTGKKNKGGVGGGATAAHSGNINTDDKKVAEELGSGKKFWEYVGSGIDYATKDLETAMVVTGGLVGTGLIASELLDEN